MRPPARLLLLLGTLACSAPAPTARTPRFTSLEPLGDAVTWFYREPSEATFTDIAMDLRALEPDLAKDRSGFGNLCAVFLWRCVERYGYRIPDAAGGRTVERARLLLSDAPGQHAEWVAWVRNPPGLSPGVLDMCWVSYFATGDARYLSIILDAASSPSPPGGLDLVAFSAEWSFKSNCQQHPAILEFARERRLAPRDDRQAQYLDECIQFAASKNAEQPRAR